MFLPAVAVDPLNPAGRPTPANIASYGFRGVRSVFRESPDWYSYHLAVKRAGLQHFVTLASESFKQASRADTVSILPTDCDWVIIGNEPDGDGPSSWKMTQAQFRTLIQDCSPAIEQRCPNAQIVAGGLVSGQPGWLDPIFADIIHFVDFFDIHPYNKTAAEAESLLLQYQAETGGFRAVVLEWNRPSTQIPDFHAMLTRQTAAGAWFCWADGMVPGFGLVDARGNAKPELGAMQAVLATQPPSPPPPPPPPGSEWSVGSGMRALMARRGDHPAADELYFKNPAGRDMWSECMAQSGRLYRYVFSTDTTYSYSPEPA